MTPLTLPSELTYAVVSASPEAYARQVASLRAAAGDTYDYNKWVKWGGVTVRFSHESVDRETGEVTRVYDMQLVWGRGIYDVAVTEEVVIAKSRNLCGITSRSGGRLRRTHFAVRAGGR